MIRIAIFAVLFFFLATTGWAASQPKKVRPTEASMLLGSVDNYIGSVFAEDSPTEDAGEVQKMKTTPKLPTYRPEPRKATKKKLSTYR